MKGRIFTEENIKEGICNNNRKVLDFVYGAFFPPAKNIILKNEGFSEDDAWDIFQDAMVILYKKIKFEKMIFSCTIQTYVIAVCKKIVLKRIDLSKRQPEKLTTINNCNIDIEEKPDFDGSDDLSIILESKYGLIYKHFKKLKKDCKKILTMFLDKISMKEIAKKMGFSGENYAKKKKHLCMGYLVKQIKEDTLFTKIQKNQNNGKF